MIRNNNVEAGYLCTVYNNIESEQEIRDSIYYQYYIDEAYKVIDTITNNDK